LTQNHIHQLGLAFQNYAISHNSFPPAYFDCVKFVIERKLFC